MGPPSGPIFGTAWRSPENKMLAGLRNLATTEEWPTPWGPPGDCLAVPKMGPPGGPKIGTVFAAPGTTAERSVGRSWGAAFRDRQGGQKMGPELPWLHRCPPNLNGFGCSPRLSDRAIPPLSQGTVALGSYMHSCSATQRIAHHLPETGPPGGPIIGTTLHRFRTHESTMQDL